MTNQSYQDSERDPFGPSGQPGGFATDPQIISGRGTGATGQEAGESTMEKTEAMAGQAQEKAGEMAGQAQEKAGEMAGQAQEKADMGLQKTAESLEKAAETLRQKAEGQDGSMSNVATTAADALEQGAGYLKGTDTEQLLDDLEAMVRQRPVESLLVAAGVGFVVSKALR